MDKDFLKTLKKHLDGIEGAEFEVKNMRNSSRKNHQFGEDIKSANEFIGALQVVDIALKKILNEAKNIDGEFEETNTQYDRVSYNIEQLIEKCSFMGMALFDVNISTNFGGTEISFDIVSPMAFILQKDMESLCGYVGDKREEIKQKLSLISARLCGEIQEEPQALNPLDSFDFREFSKMF
ncbi:flagellar FLiS export co-chaperone [Helicobacter mustelae]|uniref:Uncharacterized protein n=1 Tax=Helicobacter mustelae (strain ATCC 43772 / CCUG 25715 / CIP 103759 / LMG 18044 / NCTC 12198 / R85-136P) TaxID=679897 RepID=D3UGK1_HELM1|nr:flagellar FLiS export co-chaperone [Helicobacter mustelae]CBG39622.1 hypothetical protein Cj1650 [Helicobacter mustelae 12198]SQH71133.1 Uncharacterised protein [Helicobacter mustelae]STP12261.1 Uncharacterised protein [Helicobacter mustelae]